MRQIFGKILMVFTACLLFSTFADGQRSKKPSTLAAIYVITAKAGGVNFVAGNVVVYRADGTSGVLTKGSQLETGDEIKSSADGKAEILLNPGSFVRLAENSDIQFVSNSLDDLQIKINRGSAIFEVVATKDFTVAVTTPKSSLSIAKSGVYRVDVGENGYAKLEVWKGKAKLDKTTTVKGGQTSGIDEGQVAVVKFDRDDKDSFELWSKDRAKELAKLNAALMNRQMNNSLISYSRGFGWNNGFGLWVQDPSSRSYCFLPYGYGYNSPYGYGYNQSVWGYQSAGNSYNNQNNQNNGYNQPSNSSNNGNTMSPSPGMSNSSASPNIQMSRPMMERPITSRKGDPRVID